MDLYKISKFIFRNRLEKGLTQEELANKIGVSAHVINKWERGSRLPDVESMTALCKLFDVTYNELLSGKRLDDKAYHKNAEDNLKDLATIEVEQNKKIKLYERVISCIATATFIMLIFTASFVDEMPVWARVTLIVAGFIEFVIGISFSIRIETAIGKYECQRCGHQHIPKYSSIYLSIHAGTARYMNCPKCRTKTWQKPVNTTKTESGKNKSAEKKEKTKIKKTTKQKTTN